MKCREAESLVADWVSGRLAPDVAGPLQEHMGACQRCRDAAATEGRVRELFGSTRMEELRRDLSDDVFVRLAAPARPVRAWLPRRAPTFAFAVAGVVSAVIWFLIAGTKPAPATSPSPSTSPAVAAVDERQVVRMVADMQRVPDSSDESLLTGGVIHDPWLRPADGGGY